jgi:predicted metalloprotease
MRWEGERESSNVEDRRGMPVKGMAAGGGLVTLIIVLIALFTGRDPRPLLNQVNGGGGASPAAQQQVDPRDEPLKKFVGVVLADTEDVWGYMFPKYFNKQYPPPKLVLFNGRVDSACGMASSAVGPFYCPEDQKVYLDLAFFRELTERFKAPGDFAMAYVVAHEVGHHVQNQLGISDKVHAAKGRLSDAEYHQQSVRLELQADFLAGVWANRAQRMKNIIEQGDVEEAIRAANAIGDDTLQKQALGYVVPDSFTHGTSAQRVIWFRRVIETGDVTKMQQLFDLPYDQL